MSGTYVKGQGHEHKSLANLLYAIFCVIVQRISVKLGWYIESTSSINLMHFQVKGKSKIEKVPRGEKSSKDMASSRNLKVTVRQNSSLSICDERHFFQLFVISFKFNAINGTPFPISTIFLSSQHKNEQLFTHDFY